MKNKICKMCNDNLPISEFRIYIKNGYTCYYHICFECNKEYAKIMYQKHREKRKLVAIRNSKIYRSRPEYANEANVRHRKYYHKLKTQVFEVFGNKCQLCDCRDIDVLQIDHINNNGSKERQVFSSIQLLRKILNNNESYRILCANCNWHNRNIMVSPYVSGLRSLAINKFGGICAMCGDNRHDVLQFDHINNDGYLEAIRNYKIIYTKIISSVNIYQLLCANCHQRKTLKRILK